MAKDWNRRLSRAITLVKATAPPGFTGDGQVVATALEKRASINVRCDDTPASAAS